MQSSREQIVKTTQTISNLIESAMVLEQASAAGGVPNLSGAHGSRAALHTLGAANEGHSAEGSCQEGERKCAGHGGRVQAQMFFDLSHNSPQ